MEGRTRCKMYPRRLHTEMERRSIGSLSRERDIQSRYLLLSWDVAGSSAELNALIKNQKFCKTYYWLLGRNLSLQSLNIIILRNAMIKHRLVGGTYIMARIIVGHTALQV